MAVNIIESPQLNTVADSEIEIAARALWIYFTFLHLRKIVRAGDTKEESIFDRIYMDSASGEKLTQDRIKDIMKAYGAAKAIEQVNVQNPIGNYNMDLVKWYFLREQERKNNQPQNDETDEEIPSAKDDGPSWGDGALSTSHGQYAKKIS